MRYLGGPRRREISRFTFRYDAVIEGVPGILKFLGGTADEACRQIEAYANGSN